MPSETVDRDQLRALRALRAVFGPDQIHVLGVDREPPRRGPRDTSPPRNPGSRRGDQGRLWDA